MYVTQHHGQVEHETHFHSTGSRWSFARWCRGIESCRRRTSRYDDPLRQYDGL